MSSESFIQLGDCRYHPERQRLLDAEGQEIKLRPQSLAVLDVLVSNPREICSKDEIFKTVWPDVHVTDDSLVQCIGDIRRALNDKKHHLLKTVPRRGYLLAVESPPLSTPLPVQVDTPPPKINPPSPFQVDTYPPEIDLPSPSQVDTPAQEVSEINQAADWKHLIRKPQYALPVIALLILAVALSISSWSQSNKSTTQKAVAPIVTSAEDAPGLSVALADNKTADSAKPLAALLQELRVILGRYSTIRLVDKKDADYHLTLDAHGFGKKSSIRQATMELQGVADNTLVFAESYDIPDQDNAMHQVAIRVAAAVASPGLGALARHIRKTTRLTPIEELKPSECYVYGYGCSKCSGEEDNITERAEACLAHRIKTNPDDARAWGLQATIHAHQYWYGNTLPEPQRSTLALRKHLPAQAIKAANKAEALSSGGDSTVYWGMVEAYMASCQADKLHTAVQRGLEINPDDPNLLASFGNWLSYSGRWREGAKLTQRALDIEPKNYRKWWWMGIAKTHYRFDENEQAYAAFLKAFNERNWVSHLQLAYTLPYLGRVDEAKTAVKNMLSLYPGVTLERALEFYKVLCFDDIFLDKMKKALIIAGLPSRGSSEDFNNIQPPTAEIISVNGVDVEYMDVGEGEPVVFVHGATSDYRTWGYYMLPISENHRYISYSRRYYGTQPWPDKGEKHSIFTFADDLTAFIEALDIGPVHLVTWSSGGPIAYLVKAKRPELVKSAIHYEPVTIDPFVTETPEEKAAQATFFDTWTDFTPRLKAGDSEAAANRFMEIVYELEKGAHDQEKEITKQLFRQNARTLPVMFDPKNRDIEGVTCDFLNKIKVPTMIVHGEKTNSYWTLMAEKFAKCTPGATLKVIQGLNHKAPIEDFDGFSKLIIDFVEEHK